MKRLGSIALSLAMLVGLTGVLAAQDSNVSAEDGNTSVSIDGTVETTVFRRDNNINSILNGGVPPLGPSAGIDDNNQSGMLYHYQLGVTADVGDRVTGRIELENELLDAGAQGGPAGAGANDPALIGEGTSFESTQISEAYIKADRFLAEPLSLQIGIQDYNTDLRGDGNAFFLDLQDSEPISTSRTSVTEGGADFGRDLNNDAGGVKLTADAGDVGNLDLFWFTVREYSSSNAGGTVGNDNDEHILGGVWNGQLQDTGSYQIVGTYFQDVSGPGTTSAQGIWTVGGGVEYDVTSAANVYGEGYAQGGNRDSGSDQDTSIAIDLGVAGEAGSVFYDVSATHVSGDDGSDTGSSDDNENFVSYEDNDDTMILEDNILGLDVDSNYQKLQASGGVNGTLVRKDDISVELLAAWAQTAEEVDAFALGGSGTVDDQLGIETDLKITWAHSESLDFQVGLARLWSGDFWADDDGYNTTSDGLDLYSFTANLNF